jgi:ligand-binding sensor domain-containing protein/signal transduction histidine kinase
MNREGCKTRLGVLLVLFLSASVWNEAALALDPKKAITQYVRDVWTVENGLPQNSVPAITQTSDGYLWFGTSQGLARFDGIRFTVFNTGNTESLKNDGIWLLHGDQKGNLWIGTGGNLARLKQGKFTDYPFVVKSIYEDRDGDIWFGTDGGGLVKFHDEAFTHRLIPALTNDTVWAIYEDRVKRLWFGADAGLISFENGTLTRYTPNEGLPQNPVKAISEDREGNLWIGTDGSGLARFKNGTFTHYTTKDGLSNNFITSLCEDRDGSLWIGTQSGLNRFKDGTIARFTTQEGLSYDFVISIYEDREGSLWIGTIRGLNRLKDGVVTSFTRSEGLSSDWIMSVLEDRKGNLWIGGGRLDRFKDGKLTALTLKGGLPRDGVTSLYEDRDGGFWIGTKEGIILIKDGRLIRYTSKEWLAYNRVMAIYEDSQGNFWIGTMTGGLIRFRDGKFTVFTRKDGLPTDFVTCIYEDQRRNLWIGTDSGLVRFQGGAFIDYAMRDGKPVPQLTSIYEDQDGTLWIGTRGDGLFRFKDDRLMAYTTKEGLFDNVVTTVLEDGKGNFWMGSFRGIFRVSKRELEDFAAGKISSVTSVAYGTADGMRSIECNSNQPSGWKSRDGRLWFPTVKGVVMIDPDNMKLNTAPPPVVVEQMIADKNPIDLSRKAELAPGQRELEFHYTGLSFLDPSKVKFKYKLEGYDEDWVDAGTRRVAYYTNLSPGEYRFRVIACNNDGVWNETGAAMEFHLQPYWHERWWVRTLFSLALVLMAIALYARYRRAREEVERMATVGTVVAGVAHDASNPLLAIRTEAYNMEERPNNPEEAGTRQSQLKTIRQKAERLNSLMKDLVDFAGSIVLELTPTSPEDVLNEAVQTYREEHDPSFPQIVVEPAPGLPPIPLDRDRMVRVLMNLIENAANHARDMTTVTLSAQFAPAREKPSHICIRVVNDGAGMSRNVMRKIFKPGFTTGNGSGLGLAVVQFIIRRHGGTITVDSQPNSGTVFTICLPVKSTDSTDAHRYEKHQKNL